MNELSTPVDPMTLDDRSDLQTVLAAWHTATLRLEQTHAALREEVQHLTEELEVKNRELARKNRLADLGQMASHVAHEVRNNLVPVTLYLGLLRRRTSGDRQSQEILDKINAAFTSLDAMVNDLLNFTSDRDPCLQTFSLRQMVDDVVTSLGPQMKAQRIWGMVDVPPGQSIAADREMLRRAVLNLVLNALDAMPRGGTLVVTSVATGDRIDIEVADSGAGLSPRVLPRIFEPFFTTKPGGSGLGLAIVSRIIEAHGGEVIAANCPEGGAAFTLRLPAGSAARTSPGATDGTPVAHQHWRDASGTQHWREASGTPCPAVATLRETAT